MFMHESIENLMTFFFKKKLIEFNLMTFVMFMYKQTCLIGLIRQRGQCIEGNQQLQTDQESCTTQQK